MSKTKLLLKLNKLFKVPVHPFNLQSEGKKAYSMWQYEKGEETIKFYLPFSSKEEMFLDKTVLDIGCGAAGKSLYYASLGAKKVHGVDVVSRYKEESESLANALGLSDKFSFHLGDAANLDFPDNYFDTIIMNDSMEHVSEPSKVLAECKRVLKDGGRLFINFCPYYHPYGAHLSDVIGFPWVHLFFSEKTMIEAYKILVSDFDDKENRISFRFSKNEKGEETISYINRMTIKRFKRILKSCDMNKLYYKEIALRGFLKPLAICPVLKELFVKMTVAVLEKRK